MAWQYVALFLLGSIIAVAVVVAVAVHRTPPYEQ